MQKEDFEDIDIDTYGDDEDMRLPETDNKRWELDEEPIIQHLRREIHKRVNKVGLEEITGWLRIALNKNAALTNLETDEINDFLFYNIRAFIEECRVNNRRWGFKSPAARSAVVSWVYDAMKKQLKRAFKDGERRYRKDSYSYHENYRHDEVDNSEIGGGFRIPFFGKKKQKQRREQYEDDF